MRSALKPKTLVGTIALSLGLVFGAGVAGAQVDTYEETPPPEVVADQDETTPEVSDEAEEAEETPRVAGDDEVAGENEVVAGDDEVAADSENIAGLPVTGGDLLGMTVIGLGAVSAGGALVLYRRRAQA